MADDNSGDTGGTATATATPAQPDEPPTHPGIGTFGRDLRIWEITVRGTGGDPEKLAESIAKQVEGDDDTGAEGVTYREAGNLGNPQVHDMLARVRGQDDRETDVKARAAQQKKVTAEWEKENKKAEERGVERMLTDAERTGAVAQTASTSRAGGDKKK